MAMSCEYFIGIPCLVVHVGFAVCYLLSLFSLLWRSVLFLLFLSVLLVQTDRTCWAGLAGCMVAESRTPQVFCRRFLVIRMVVVVAAVLHSLMAMAPPSVIAGTLASLVSRWLVSKGQRIQPYSKSNNKLNQPKPNFGCHIKTICVTLISE